MVGDRKVVIRCPYQTAKGPVVTGYLLYVCVTA